MGSIWSELVRSRAFWVGYVSAGVDVYQCPTLHADLIALEKAPYCRVSLSFPFEKSHQLRLDIAPGAHWLYHLDCDYENPQLVGCFEAHGMGNLFRWDEFRAVTRQQSKTCGPPWAVELLFGFYVARTADLPNEFEAVLRRCMIASNVFCDAEIDYVVSSNTMRSNPSDFRWLNVPDLGWVADGRRSYCMRHTRGDFDFARFGRFLAILATDAD